MPPCCFAFGPGGRRGGALDSTTASQSGGPGFESRWDLSVWSLHVLHVPVWVYSGYSGFLLQSKDVQIRLLGVRALTGPGCK